MGCSDSSGGLGFFFFFFSLFSFFSSSFIHYNKHTTTTEHRSVHLSLAMYNGHNYTNIHVLSVHT